MQPSAPPTSAAAHGQFDCVGRDSGRSAGRRPMHALRERRRRRRINVLPDRQAARRAPAAAAVGASIAGGAAAAASRTAASRQLRRGCELPSHPATPAPHRRNGRRASDRTAQSLTVAARGQPMQQPLMPPPSRDRRRAAPALSARISRFGPAIGARQQRAPRRAARGRDASISSHSSAPTSSCAVLALAAVFTMHRKARLGVRIERLQRVFDARRNASSRCGHRIGRPFERAARQQHARGASASGSCATAARSRRQGARSAPALRRRRRPRPLATGCSEIGRHQRQLQPLRRNAGSRHGRRCARRSWPRAGAAGSPLRSPSGRSATWSAGSSGRARRRAARCGRAHGAARRAPTAPARRRHPSGAHRATLTPPAR